MWVSVGVVFDPSKGNYASVSRTELPTVQSDRHARWAAQRYGPPCRSMFMLPIGLHHVDGSGSLQGEIPVFSGSFGGMVPASAGSPVNMHAGVIYGVAVSPNHHHMQHSPAHTLVRGGGLQRAVSNGPGRQRQLRAAAQANDDCQNGYRASHVIVPSHPAAWPPYPLL